jgi:tetratricopeptide (TPR) repeat protein
MIKNKIFYIIIILGILIIRIHGADTKEIQKPENENLSDTTYQSKIIPEEVQQKCADLDLGKMLEQVGRLEDANKAYLEALKSNDPDIRSQAIQAIERLDSFTVKFYSRYRNFVRSIVDLITNPVLLIMIGCLIIIPIIRFINKKIGTRKAPKIEVNPLKISPSSNTYLHFRAYMELIIDRMNYYNDLRMQISTTELRSAKPTIRSETWSQFFEETANVIAPKFGQLLFKFIKLKNPPEFVVEGFIDMTDANLYNNIVSLKRRGKAKRTWEVNLSPSEISEGLKDLAYDVLVFLKTERR